MSAVSLILKFAKYILFVLSLFLLYQSVNLSVKLLNTNTYESVFDYFVSFVLLMYLFVLGAYYTFRKIVLDDTVLQSLIWTVLTNGVVLVVFYYLVTQVVIPMEILPFEIPDFFINRINITSSHYDWKIGKEVTNTMKPQKIGLAFYSFFFSVSGSLVYIVYRLYQYRDLLTLRNIFRNG